MQPVVSSSSRPLNRNLQQQKVALNAVGFNRKSKFSRELVELHCLLGAWLRKRERSDGTNFLKEVFLTLVLIR